MVDIQVGAGAENRGVTLATNYGADRGNTWKEPDAR